MSDITDLLRTLGLAVTIKAADEIERLRQRVKELEGYEQECSNLEAELIDYQDCLAELSDLRNQQD